MAETEQSQTDRSAQREDYYKRFFSQEVQLTDEARDVLVNYSKIPPERLEDHVRAIRDKAWAVFPYPCIGLYRFLHLAIGNHVLYKDEILPRMLTGQNYLDLGCAFAQDIRRLVADGVDSTYCFGSDLRLDFIDLGYELFNDRETLESRFIAADIFDIESPLKELYGEVDIVDASSFFHLFNLNEQKTIAKTVIKLLRPQKDSLVVGRQVGDAKPAEYPRRSGNGTRFRHDIESWRSMWDEVGEECGVKFEVGGRMWEVEGRGSMSNATSDVGQDARMMEFWVRRVQ